MVWPRIWYLYFRMTNRAPNGAIFSAIPVKPILYSSLIYTNTLFQCFLNCPLIETFWLDVHLQIRCYLDARGRRPCHVSKSVHGVTLTSRNEHEFGTETCPGYGFYAYGIHSCRIINILVNSVMGFWIPLIFFLHYTNNFLVRTEIQVFIATRFPFPSFE